MNKFSDFGEKVVFDGDKIKLDDVLNMEIVVKNYKVSGSKYKSNSCLTLHIVINNENRVIFTGSQVLLEQIKRHEAMMPFATVVKKIDKYYTFT